MPTRLLSRGFVAVLCVAIASCRSSTDAESHDLVGTWATPRKSLQPGSYQQPLTFGRDGRYTSEVRDYGLYPGQSSNELSAYTRIVGTYEIRGDSVATHAEEHVWWDRFYGTDSPEHREVYENAPFSASQFEIGGSTLVLHYISYPADAGVPTTMTFVRLN